MELACHARGITVERAGRATYLMRNKSACGFRPKWRCVVRRRSSRRLAACPGTEAMSNHKPRAESADLRDFHVVLQHGGGCGGTPFFNDLLKQSQ